MYWDTWRSHVKHLTQSILFKDLVFIYVFEYLACMYTVPGAQEVQKEHHIFQNGGYGHL